MGTLFGLFNLSFWGLALRAFAIVHFIRRRPENYWLLVILFIPLGSMIYIVFEVIPDLGLLRQSFLVFPRRKRIKQLEALVGVNPAAANLEELGDLYLDDRRFPEAFNAFNLAIASRVSSDDAFYRRAIAAIHTGDFATALTDLEYITGLDPRYDLHRAMGLLGHVYARSGRASEAETAFRKATEASTISETYLNYAEFLAGQQRHREARTWAQRVLDKKAAMPNYLRRRERAWFRNAIALLKRLPAA